MFSTVVRDGNPPSSGKADDCGLLVLVYLFLVGAAAPVILWLVTRKFPHTLLNYLKYAHIYPPGNVNDLLAQHQLSVNLSRPIDWV